MNRLVFQLADSVAPDNSPYVAISLEEPRVFGSQARPFSVSMAQAPFAALTEAEVASGAVHNAGRALYDELLKHPELQQTMAAALLTQLPDHFPVLVEIATGTGVESLPWETLCTPNDDFLGLDERWAVGRLVAGPVTSPPVWYLEPSLRVAAVLSCLGVPAADEWTALHEALTGAAGLKTEILLLVSEEPLYLAVKTAAPTHVTVELVPSDVPALQERVARFRPHVVHFFCHGSTTDGPHLQVAVKTDWDTGTPDRSLVIEARDIRHFAAPTNDAPWLVVLNCCESGAGSEVGDLQSLALKLVYDGGIPAVVGMREPVMSDDASLFTAAFHKRLSTELAGRLAAPENGGSVLDFGAMAVAARACLARKYLNATLNKAAGSTKQWTLPVIYMRSDPVVVQAAATELPASERGAGPPADPDVDSNRAMRLELEALRNLLVGLPPQSPQGLRDEVAEHIAVLTGQLGAA